MKPVHLAIIAPLLWAPALPPATAQETPPPPSFSRVRDPQGMYARALVMLKDTTIKNVSSVPAMLEECVNEGYIPAVYTLLDVYEGKYVGLAAQPQKAARLAYRFAKVPRRDDEAPDAKALRHEAMFRSAIYCERGFGCQKSATDAFRWMYNAAAENMPKARVELARYYMNGIGCEPNPRLALRLLREQAEKAPDTPNLFFYLGHMYFHGIGLPHKDRAQALHYFRLGDARGDARATNNLGIMYERGIGVPQDTQEALRLYKKAAAAGNKEASANMQRLGSRAGEEPEEDNTVSQRVCNASLRVIMHLPVTHHLKEMLMDFFAEGSTAPHS